MGKNIFLCFVCVLVAGCSFYRVDSRDTSLNFYTPKDSPEKVAYLEKVDKPFDVIGTVTVFVERTRPFEDVLIQMKREAAILGGDALTDLRKDFKMKGPKVVENAAIRVNYSAQVIAFK